MYSKCAWTQCLVCTYLLCLWKNPSETWWRHQMEPFSALPALCARNSPVPMNSPHKGQWRGALMFSLISPWINNWVNNRDAGDLRRHRGHYDVNVMNCSQSTTAGWDTALDKLPNLVAFCFLWLKQHSSSSTKFFLLEMRWQVHITDGELSYNFGRNLCCKFIRIHFISSSAETSPITEWIFQSWSEPVMWTSAHLYSLTVSLYPVNVPPVGNLPCLAYRNIILDVTASI